MFACPKCRQPVCPDECCSDHDCDLLASLGDLNDEVEIRFRSLIPCLGAAKLIRLKRKDADPVNRLTNNRDDSFKLADWEEEIVRHLIKSKIEGLLVSKLLKNFWSGSFWSVFLNKRVASTHFGLLKLSLYDRRIVIYSVLWVRQPSNVENHWFFSILFASHRHKEPLFPFYISDHWVKVRGLIKH